MQVGAFAALKGREQKSNLIRLPRMMNDLRTGFQYPLAKDSLRIRFLSRDNAKFPSRSHY